MAQLTKIITQLENHIEKIKDEIYDREEQADNQIDKWEGWEYSDKGSYYISKTEALDELVDLLFEAQYKAEQIKKGDY
jgi:hypothetical protein